MYMHVLIDSLITVAHAGISSFVVVKMLLPQFSPKKKPKIALHNATMHGCPASDTVKHRPIHFVFVCCCQRSHRSGWLKSSYQPTLCIVCCCILYVYFLPCICCSIFLSFVYLELGPYTYNSIVLAPHASGLHCPLVYNYPVLVSLCSVVSCVVVSQTSVLQCTVMSDSVFRVLNKDLYQRRYERVCILRNNHMTKECIRDVRALYQPRRLACRSKAAQRVRMCLRFSLSTLPPLKSGELVFLV